MSPQLLAFLWHAGAAALVLGGHIERRRRRLAWEAVGLAWSGYHLQRSLRTTWHQCRYQSALTPLPPGGS